MPAKPDVLKRGERRGEAVEKRPPGEAEHDAARAEDNVPLDAATGAPIEHPERGRMDRGGDQPADYGTRDGGLARTTDREPDDNE
jgi:hypothetical protein